MRKIIHIDMDAFYAAIEQRDNPQLRGRAVVVGGAPDSRSVVCTCSYEARKFGVHSAMASSVAQRRCPHAVFLPVRMAHYQNVSKQIRKIFFEYSDLVEPLSLDEAFIDVTENKKFNPSATLVARDIQRRIFAETALTASAGVSFNKFLAKTASDWRKPAGLTVITPEQALEFMEKLPIEKFYGVGRATAAKMKHLGIRCGGDLIKYSLRELIDLFGKNGVFFYNIVRGKDDRMVKAHRVRKSLGREVTLDEDVNDSVHIRAVLRKLCAHVAELLQAGNLSGRTVTLKIKFADFRQITRSKSLPSEIWQQRELQQNALELLNKVELQNRKIRLLGISVSSFAHENEFQMFQPQLPLVFESTANVF